MNTLSDVRARARGLDADIDRRLAIELHVRFYRASRIQSRQILAAELRDKRKEET